MRLSTVTWSPASDAPSARSADEIKQEGRDDAPILVEIDLLRPPSRCFREFPVPMRGRSCHDHEGDKGDRGPAGHDTKDEGDGAQHFDGNRRCGPGFRIGQSLGSKGRRKGTKAQRLGNARWQEQRRQEKTTQEKSCVIDLMHDTHLRFDVSSAKPARWNST